VFVEFIRHNVFLKLSHVFLMDLDVILIGLNIANNIGLDFNLKLGPIEVSDPNYSYCRLMNMIFILYSWIMLSGKF